MCSNEYLATLGVESEGQFCSIQCATASHKDEDNNSLDQFIANVDIESLASQSQFSLSLPLSQPSIIEQPITTVCKESESDEYRHRNDCQSAITTPAGTSSRLTATTPFDSTLQFPTLDALVSFMKEHAGKNGFKVHVQKHKGRDKMDYVRGNVQCTNRTSVPELVKEKYPCPYRATFCINQAGAFVFTKSNMQHNHSILPPSEDQQQKLSSREQKS